MNPKNTIIHGPRTIPTQHADGPIADVISNRTLLIQDLGAPDPGARGQFFEGAKLSDFVGQVQPERRYQVELGARGTVELTARYGEEEPSEVLEDFRPSALTWRTRDESAERGPGVPDRPLLELLLRVEALKSMQRQLRREEIRRVVAQPTGRAEILQVLREELEAITRALGLSDDAQTKEV